MVSGSDRIGNENEMLSVANGFGLYRMELVAL